MRKLASIRKIDQILPIENSDSIECAVVGGWCVVTKRGEFQKDTCAVFVEIDSWVPDHIAPFLSKGQPPRLYNDIPGQRLRTVKLRGQVSQGLLLPLSIINDPSLHKEGVDVTDLLGIQKWEAPIPAQLAGDVVGGFPSFIPKTDQERIQNLPDEIAVWGGNSAFTWEVSEKLDGSSMTVFVNGEQQGVCSRNWMLKEDPANTFWKVARKERLIEKILSCGRNLALQGELVGEGIQGNPYKIQGQKFYVYDIYDIDRGMYLLPNERRVMSMDLQTSHVPVVSVDVVAAKNISAILAGAEGMSRLNSNTEREGFVYKSNQDHSTSFKAISNKFLLKEK